MSVSRYLLRLHGEESHLQTAAGCSSFTIKSASCEKTVTARLSVSLNACANTAPKIVEEQRSFQFLIHQLPDKQLIGKLAEAEAQKKGGHADGPSGAECAVPNASLQQPTSALFITLTAPSEGSPGDV